MKNTPNTFPVQKLPISKKNEEWQKTCVDYIIGSGETARNGRDRNRLDEMQTYYDLYNSIYNEKDLKYVTNPFKQDDGFPATAQDYNIIRPKIDLLLGEETKRPFNFKVCRTSDIATSEVQDKAKKMLLDYVQAAMMAKLSPEDQQRFQEGLQSGEIMPPESIQRYLTRDYKDIAEITAFHTINYLRYKNNVDHEFVKGLKDALISGEEIYYVGIINGEPVLEKVNPKYFDYENSEDLEFIHDATWCCRRMFMSYADVYDRFYDKMTESQLNDLLDLIQGKPGDHGSDKGPMDYNSIKIHFNQTPFDHSDEITVYHTCWKSFKKIGFVTIMNQDGEQEEIKVDETYRVTGNEINVEWDWIIEVWEGYRIGDDMYIGVQPIEYQDISASNPNARKLPYTGAVYSNTNSKPRSLVSIMKPLQYMYIVVWYRLELAMARDKGKVLTVDITQIPKGLGIDVNKWMHYLSALGVNFINPYDEGWDIPGREGGKCFGKGTKILMSNGRLKNIEDILVGDKIMGPDGLERTVLELHNGVDNMYKVIPSSGGDIQLVNSRHDIYYGYKNHHTGKVNFCTSTPEELMLKFKKIPSCRDKYFLYRKDKLNFDNSDLLLDPYILGLWLGDGFSSKPSFESMDIEIINYLNNFAYTHGMKTNIKSNDNSKSLTISLSGGSVKKYRNLPGNWFLDRLDELNIRDYKDIPDNYIYTSEENRLKLLAGLIDTDGWYDKKKNRFGFSQVSYRKHIVDKFTFIARSLGMKVSVRKKEHKPSKICKNATGYSYVVSILSGCERIPTKVGRKQTNQVKFFAKDTNRSMFNIEYAGVNEYFGFSLDKDHLFLLGDLTIAHNSSQFNQITAMDLTMANIIDQYINLMSKIEDMMAEISGVSRQREGSISSNELVGNVTRAVIQSANITEPLFWLHNQVKKHAITMLLNTARVAWKNNDKESLNYILDDTTRAFIKFSDDFYYDDLDVFVSDSTKDQQTVERLRNLMQPAMQNGASLLDIAEIMTLDNTTMIKNKLEEIENKRIQQQQAMQEQQNQQDMQMQQMQNDVKQQELLVKQRELDITQYKIDQDNATKITVAELQAYRGAQEMDADQNGIPDPIEIGNQALEQQKVYSEQMFKQQDAINKRRDIEYKHSIEKQKIEAQKKSDELKGTIEKERIALENKKLEAAKQLQTAKDDAAYQRELLKSKTALKNKVVGQR